MIQSLIAKFATTNAACPANAVRLANAGRTPPFGHPGGLSVRLPHLTYIRSRHGPRLFDACNTNPPLKVLRLGKLILAFLKSCSKSLHFFLSVSSAVVDNQRQFLKKVWKCVSVSYVFLKIFDALLIVILIIVLNAWKLIYHAIWLLLPLTEIKSIRNAIAFVLK